MQKVKDIMTSPVISVAPNALIEDALETMLRHKISGLPVVDENGVLVGVISEFDALTFLTEQMDSYSPIAPVAHFMTQPVEAVDAEVTLAEVTEIFRQMGVRRLPVLSGGKLVGIISRRDLVRVIRDQRRQAANEMFSAAGQLRPIRWVQMPEGTLEDDFQDDE